jgi:hypothetical protein
MIKQITDYINKNGGITLDENLNTQELSSGYMVSLAGFEIVTTESKLLDALILISYKLKYDTIYTPEKLYVGVWKNAGKLYVDISMKISNKARALDFGFYQKQLAIFNNSTKETITI